MKTHKIVTFCLLTMGCVTMQAQNAPVRLINSQLGQAETPQDGTAILAESGFIFLDTPETVVDEETKVKTVKLRQNENWPTDDKIHWVKNVKTIDSSEQLNRLLSDKLVGDKSIIIHWALKEEADRSVLHCYFRMPADAVTNLWLASEETCIVDLETGVQYRAQKDNPDCWKKYFGVKAPAGTILDFPIYFPKLPESVKHIAIYGVPLWHLRGIKVGIDRNKKVAFSFGVPKDYDDAPQISAPRLVKAEGKYVKNDGNTWAVYTDAHLIKPLPDNYMALWRTPETTYLAVSREQNWMREYFSFQPDNFLIDERGRQYKIKGVQGLPLEHIFWMEGYSGDCIAFVLEFEPIPLDITTISLIQPEGKPFDSWGADWSGKTFLNMNITDLRKNQQNFKLQKRVIVE